MKILIVSACLIYSMFASAAPVNAKDAKLISRVKNLPVAKLDPALPAVSFEKWLGAEAGPEAKSAWEVNDCGEQTGAAGQTAEIPTCVETDAWLKDGREIVIMIAASQKDGKSRSAGSFTVYLAQLITPRERITIKQLSDFPAALIRTHELVHYPEIAQ